MAKKERQAARVDEIDEFDSGDLADEQQLVSFKLGSEEYAVDIMQVQEIIRPTEITKLPKVPQFIEGVIDLRGKVLPIVDLRKRFDMPEGKRTSATRVVVTNINSMILGLVVDSVSEVLRLPTKAIEPPPKIVSGIDSRFLKGIGRLQKRLLILLDLEAIFSDKEIALINEVAEKEREGAVEASQQ